MATLELATNCLTHPSARAIARCDHCGKAICMDCRVEDVAAEEVFCSDGCRTTRSAWRTGPAPTANEVLLEGFDRPIARGWSLWFRSMRAVLWYTAPVVVLLSAVLYFNPGILEPDPAPGFAPAEEPPGAIALLLALALLVYGAALTQVVLSREYTGLIAGNPYWWTAKWFIPWALTWTLMFAIVMAGTLALLLPGMYLGLRLFWAEEFALVHGKWPIAAIRESWRLTRDNAGQVFAFQFLAGLAAYGVYVLVFLAFLAISLGASMFSPPEALSSAFTAPLLIWALYIVYAGVFAPEVVYLYGMRAQESVSIGARGKTLGLG